MTGMAPGSRIGDFGEPLPVEGFEPRLRQRHRPAADRDARRRRRPGPGALKPGVDDPGTPTLGDFIVVLDGVAVPGTHARHRRGGAAGRRAPPPGHRPGPLRQARACCPASCTPWPAREVAYLLLVDRPVPAGVRVLHRRRRRGRRGRRRLPGARLLRRARPAQPAVGVGPAHRVDRVLRRRRPDRGPSLLDRRRRRRLRRWPRGSSTPTTAWAWLTLAVGIVGVLLAFLVGMPSMVRTRFATPTIGREWMVGELGEAVVAVDPEGVVRDRGRPVAGPHEPGHAHRPGRTVRVVAIDGVTLEVEPEEGGARDYRERARAATAVTTPTTTRNRPPPHDAPV